MRYIDTSSINVPLNWLDLAKAKLGNTYKSPWSYFKNDFEALVGTKCWYSESINIGSNNPIDHFRPKGDIVKQLPEYDQIKPIIHKININSGKGYPFLKYEFTNYRYACDIVNSPNRMDTQDGFSRGKWDYFPISINSSRLTSANDPANEQYCLLDPCNSEDVKLLTFNNLGYIEINSTKLQSSWEYCKALVSIEVYHLHYYKFVEARLKIWKNCEDTIRKADLIYANNPKSEAEKYLLSGFIKDIIKGIKKNEQFSATVIDCIKHNKQKYLWLDKIFTETMLEK